MAYITITTDTDDGVITFQERVATGQMGLSGHDRR